uniref:Uncharacterized protein n=1 Tax=Kalanchoe fedtschenkoi TaxID=63787 RepID=A0A7N0TD19_KALFE
MEHTNTCGRIQIKCCAVPGYSSTGPASQNIIATGNTYLHPRSHRNQQPRLGLLSFGTYSPAIISQLQLIFEADWKPPYTIPVQPLQESQAYIS